MAVEAPWALRLARVAAKVDGGPQNGRPTAGRPPQRSRLTMEPPEHEKRMRNAEEAGGPQAPAVTPRNAHGGLFWPRLSCQKSKRRRRAAIGEVEKGDVDDHKSLLRGLAR